jgi:hypothetical protein
VRSEIDQLTKFESFPLLENLSQVSECSAMGWLLGANIRRRNPYTGMRYHHRPWASPGSRPPNPSWAGGFVDHNSQAVRWMGHRSQQQLSSTSQSIRNGVRASQNMNWTRCGVEWSRSNSWRLEVAAGRVQEGKSTHGSQGYGNSASSARPTRKG